MCRSVQATVSMHGDMCARQVLRRTAAQRVHGQARGSARRLTAHGCALEADVKLLSADEHHLAAVAAGRAAAAAGDAQAARQAGAGPRAASRVLGRAPGGRAWECSAVSKPLTPPAAHRGKVTGLSPCQVSNNLCAPPHLTYSVSPASLAGADGTAGAGCAGCAPPSPGASPGSRSVTADCVPDRRSGEGPGPPLSPCWGAVGSPSSAAENIVTPDLQGQGWCGVQHHDSLLPAGKTHKKNRR